MPANASGIPCLVLSCSSPYSVSSPLVVAEEAAATVVVEAAEAADNSNLGTIVGAYIFTIIGTGTPTITPAPTTTITVTVN